jgi:hypothetical protein
MSQVANTSWFFSCLLEIAEPSVSSGFSTNVLAFMYGTEYSDVPVLSRPDLFTVHVNFFDPSVLATYFMTKELACDEMVDIYEGFRLQRARPIHTSQHSCS